MSGGKGREWMRFWDKDFDRWTGILNLFIAFLPLHPAGAYLMWQDPSGIILDLNLIGSVL